MPIYDNNGTTSYEIGNLYDNDGTTSYQIGKVYDNNGTTSSLIYSSDENVLTSGVTAYPAGYTSREATHTCSSTSLTMTTKSVFGSGGGIHNVYTNTTFDLTGMSTITFTVSTTAAEYNRSYTSLYVGVVKTLPTATGSWLPSGFQSAGVDNAMRVINEKEWKLERNTAIAGSYSLDVSGLSGSYYITFCISMGDGYGASTDATFSNVMLS